MDSTACCRAQTRENIETVGFTSGKNWLACLHDAAFISALSTLYDKMRLRRVDGDYDDPEQARTQPREPKAISPSLGL